MANQEHLDILKQGVEVWNQWREEHAEIQPDLKGAILQGDGDLGNLGRTNLSRADLGKADLYFAKLYSDGSLANLGRANLSRADLGKADLQSAYLYKANLSKALLYEANLEQANLEQADLSGANLNQANLLAANLTGANLTGATLSLANLSGTNLSGANLSGANLEGTMLVSTNFAEATLTDCRIYGIAAWSMKLKGARQNNLIITPWNEPTITVDNLEVAQFVYLLLNNPKIRDVIDTIARKAVLILGRFTPERKAILDALREALRTQDYVPILFDFDRPSSRNVTETVKTLAHLSRFIIADLTDPSSIPYELAQIVPGLAVPVQPVLLERNRAFAMFPDLPRTYHWVLPIHYYTDQAHLLATLQEHVIAPAEQKAQELEKR